MGIIIFVRRCMDHQNAIFCQDVRNLPEQFFQYRLFDVLNHIGHYDFIPLKIRPVQLHDVFTDKLQILPLYPVVMIICNPDGLLGVVHPAYAGP